MNFLNRIICFFRGHEDRYFEVTRYERGFRCLRCGRAISWSDRKCHLP